LEAGALHVRAEGDAEPPAEAHDADAYAVLVGAEAGLWIPLHRHVAVRAAFAAHLALPHVVVRVAEAPVARVGLPSFLATLGVVLRS
jgi:hypothetical protein